MARIIAGPIAENAAPAPMSPYGQHKLMMEQLCRSYAMTFGIAQHGRAVVLGLRPASAQAIAVGHLFAAAAGRTDTGSWRNRRRNTRLDRCARRGSVVGDNRRATAAGNVSGYQWRLGSRHQRRRNREHAGQELGQRRRRALFRRRPGGRSLQPAGRRRQAAQVAVRLADPGRAGDLRTM